MRYVYQIEWMDGHRQDIPSTRFCHANSAERNLVVYVDEHGHDRRFDEIVIPLNNVRRYKILEVR